MTLEELHSLLETTGYPVAYYQFDKPQSPPYIAYVEEPSANFMADNKVYKKISDVRIELYTVKKDLKAESKLETILDDNHIPYETDETFVESQELFMKIFEVRLI